MEEYVTNHAELYLNAMRAINIFSQTVANILKVNGTADEKRDAFGLG